MGSKGFLAGNASSLAAGCWPRRRAPQQSAPACPGHPGSRCLALASGDGGVDGDETPRVSTSHTGTAILNLPVPLGVQPGTFGGPLLAPESTVQPMSAGCKHRPLASGRSRVSAEDRRRPLLSVTDHPAQKCDSSHMAERAAGPDPRRPPPVGRERAGNSGCHTSPASWIAWEEQSADRAREPSGYSRSGGKRRQRSRQAKRRRLPGCLPPRCWSRSSAPGLRSGGRSGTREAG